MVHWTQIGLKRNREQAEAIINAYYGSEEELDKLMFDRMIYEIQLKLGCSEKKSYEYYQWVLKKKKLGL